MLTPMQVQYLVGLCCLRCNPDAVDITIGDMVADIAAKKERDVDVTVTLNEKDGSRQAFKAYEVKREGKPLGVVPVEQLCAKLNDMPALTSRAIVSASGYTKGAIAKAEARSVDLYTLKPWMKPIAEQFPAFPGIGRPEEFLRGFQTNLLHWDNPRIFLVLPEAKSSMTWTGETPIFDSAGVPHVSLPTMGHFLEALLMRSTETLFGLEPAQTILRTFPILAAVGNSAFESSPPWPHTHSMDTRQHQVHLKHDDRILLVDSVTITGALQWRRQARVPQFHIVEHVPTGEVFAAAAVASYGLDDGRMFAMIFPSDSRTLGVHQFQLSEKHRNAIRKLSIPLQ